MQRLGDLQPGDPLPRDLLREMRWPQAAAAATAPPRPGAAGQLAGAWTARPRAGTTIRLNLQARGQLECSVLQGIEQTSYAGFYLKEGSTLLLAQDQDNTLVGELTWTDTRHFTFRLFESRADEPALAFEKVP